MQDVFSKEYTDKVRHNGNNGTNEENRDAHRLQSRKEVGSGTEANDGNKEIEAHAFEEPACCRRNQTRVLVLTLIPAKEKACKEGATAGTKGNRDLGNINRDSTDEKACNDPP